jgi:hypothetical protein
MSIHPKKSEPLRDDLIWGVDGENGIAAELGIPTSKAYYLISTGAIPVRRHTHKIITASRRELRRRFAGQAPSDPEAA